MPTFRSLALAAPLFLASARADSWNKWQQEGDVTITKTSTQFNYYCPCESQFWTPDPTGGRSYTGDNSWAAWSELSSQTSGFIPHEITKSRSFSSPVSPTSTSHSFSYPTPHYSNDTSRIVFSTSNGYSTSMMWPSSSDTTTCTTLSTSGTSTVESTTSSYDTTTTTTSAGTTTMTTTSDTTTTTESTTTLISTTTPSTTTTTGTTTTSSTTTTEATTTSSTTTEATTTSSSTTTTITTTEATTTSSTTTTTSAAPTCSPTTFVPSGQACGGCTYNFICNSSFGDSDAALGATDASNCATQCDQYTNCYAFDYDGMGNCYLYARQPVLSAGNDIVSYRTNCPVGSCVNSA